MFLHLRSKDQSPPHIQPLTDIDWIRNIKRIVRIETNAPVFRTGADTGILYCLSGGRFPWGCIGREISLLQSARLALRLAVKLCRMKWRRIRGATGARLHGRRG